MEMFFRFPGFKTKAVTLSYDDGTVFDKKMIEILDKYKIKATFNLNSGLFGGGRHLSLEEVKELYKGREIAVHTVSHPHLENLSDGEVCYEILQDRKNLEEIAGKIVDGMAYPFGLFDRSRVPELVGKCGISFARTTRATKGFSLPDDFLRWDPTCHHIDPEIFTLIDAFLEPEDAAHPWRTVPKLFYLWGHSYEFNDQDNWDLLTEICQRLGEKEEVWYAENGEIQKYISAYKKLQKSCDGSMVFNPTNVTLYTVVDCKHEVKIAPGELIKL